MQGCMPVVNPIEAVKHFNYHFYYGTHFVLAIQNSQISQNTSYYQWHLVIRNEDCFRMRIYLYLLATWQQYEESSKLH
jgi:hypothetical protein